jgi:hypothetical protein
VLPLTQSSLPSSSLSVSSVQITPAGSTDGEGADNEALSTDGGDGQSNVAGEAPVDTSCVSSNTEGGASHLLAPATRAQRIYMDRDSAQREFSGVHDTGGVMDKAIYEATVARRYDSTEEEITERVHDSKSTTKRRLRIYRQASSGRRDAWVQDETLRVYPGATADVGMDNEMSIIAGTKVTYWVSRNVSVKGYVVAVMCPDDAASPTLLIVLEDAGRASSGHTDVLQEVAWSALSKDAGSVGALLLHGLLLRPILTEAQRKYDVWESARKASGTTSTTSIDSRAFRAARRGRGSQSQSTSVTVGEQNAGADASGSESGVHNESDAEVEVFEVTYVSSDESDSGVNVQLQTCNKKCADARKARKRQRKLRKLEKEELDEKEQVRHTRLLDLAVTARDRALDDLKKANTVIANLRKQVKTMKDTAARSANALQNNTCALESANTRVTVLEKQRDEAVSAHKRVDSARGRHKIAIAQHVAFLKTFIGQLAVIAGPAAFKAFVNSQQQ